MRQLVNRVGCRVPWAMNEHAAITNDEKPFDSSDTVSPFFTFPPDKAQIEQETAEACASYLSSRAKPNLEAAQVMDDTVYAIRSGAWKEFKNGLSGKSRGNRVNEQHPENGFSCGK